MRPLGGVIVALAVACSSTRQRAEFVSAHQVQSPHSQQAEPHSARGECATRECTYQRELDQRARYLKCHLADGGVFVLQNWKIDLAQGQVLGDGLAYDAERQLLRSGDLRVPIADVVLFETNQPESVMHAGVPVMAVVATASVALSALCLANPKACFGSCPTFYAPTDAGFELQAEGFSHSIAKALESTDIDPLPLSYSAKEGDFRLWVTNEAPETHAIRSVVLLAVPRAEDERVFRSGEHFFGAKLLRTPSACSLGDECRQRLSRTDDDELLALSDPTDLASRHEFELQFERAATDPNQLGVVLVVRNSLLNTYLLYQALSSLGAEVGEQLAKLERGEPLIGRGVRAAGQLLGGLEVSVHVGGGEFRPLAIHTEVGPIAKEVVLLRLPDNLPSGPIRLRLSEARGNFKLDQASLVALTGQREPRRLKPKTLSDVHGENAAQLTSLLDPERYLVTYPGDAYALDFVLPGDGPHELFVESRGYYYEWMRKVWLDSPGIKQPLRWFTDTSGVLKELAPDYKRIEADIERYFWQSRVKPRGFQPSHSQPGWRALPPAEAERVWQGLSPSRTP